MTRKTLYTMLVALQLLFLLVVAGSYYGIDQFGKVIRLQTAPVDPNDFFYGDYVTLNYEISNLNASLWKGEGTPAYGDVVYVVLKPDGDVYRAVAVYPDKPSVSGEEIVLQGTSAYGFSLGMHVQYGIERYYVPEGTGKLIEEKTRAGKATVVLKIAPWGQMKITNLELH